MSGSRLVILTRYPTPGRVKTRLQAALGEEQTALLHGEMVEYTLATASAWSGKARIDLEVRIDGASEEEFREWLGSGQAFVTQGEGDLGARMSRSFEDGFNRGDDRIVLIGTDMPQLTPAHLTIAFERLLHHDLVLLPATDGGYGLIGLRSPAPELFTGIAWGSGDVLNATVDKAAGRGLSVSMLKPLGDVDTPEDLPLWERTADRFISVIIPTFNEEGNILSTLERVGDIPGGEVIIVDGGSSDGTVETAEGWGARVVLSHPGRGRQMDLGAEEATGDILLFLHADTLLPEDWHTVIREAMSDPLTVGGAFSWKVDAPGPFLRWIERTVEWRIRLFNLPYGDQAIFVKASVFRELDGYISIPLMEDVDLVRRLRKYGNLARLNASVTTSARRYERYGPFRTTMRNKVILFGYYLGIRPEQLARWYYRHSADSEVD
ncbi:TIGR04283 family arsenosugar biosynthesis glycosyltransferase [Gemmatimonadota bacterium]